jgi:peptidoglycan hydrolase CwlO-like protein
MGSSSHISGDVPVVETSSLPRWVILLFIVAFALVAYLIYASYSERQSLAAAQADAAKKNDALAAEIDKANSRIADLKGQLDVTSQKLGLTQDELAHARTLAQSIKKDQDSSDLQLRQQIGAVQADTTSKIGQVSTQINGTQTDLNATKADLESTKASLTRTVGDLGVQSGLIATNEKQLDELKHMGDRDIFDFTLTKTKKPEHVGPIQVQLTKIDAKHFKYTLNVIADDKNIPKKDKTVDEPVQFFVNGAKSPYEIVVFDLSKDQAKGYLSTPKVAGSAPASSNPTPPGN